MKITIFTLIGMIRLIGFKYTRGSVGSARGSVGWACVAHLSFCFEEI